MVQHTTVFSLASRLALLASAASAQRDKYQPCPLLGPFVPEPSLNASSPVVKDAFSPFTTLLDDYVAKADGEFGPISPNTTSFSIAVFAGSRSMSASDGSPILYEYHHTASGVRGILDNNSVFALSDLTSVFTVYTQLVELGYESWATSITDYLGELKRPSDGPITQVQWGNVNLGALAGHMSGIARESEACSVFKPCNRTHFLTVLDSKIPVELPDTTPIRSDAGFQLLALAVEEKSKKPFAENFMQRIAEPLGLARTKFLEQDAPIFGDGLSNVSTNGEQAALGLTSSIQDLATLGRAMLNSKLLPASTTRRWLKPFSSTSNLRNAVGRPWEIYHYGREAIDPVIDVYTKTGSIGRYSSYFGLAPSHDVGFAILAVDTQEEAPDLNAHADVALNALLAVDKLGRVQANATISGWYRDAGASGNSTLVIGPALSSPDVAVTELIINGTNWLRLIATKADIPPSDLDFRLYPTNLEKAASGESTRAFRAVLQDKNALADAGTPTCISWQTVDILERNGLPLDAWVLHSGTGGLVNTVEIPALGVNLHRSKSD